MNETMNETRYTIDKYSQTEDTIKTGKSNFEVLFTSSKTWLYKLILVSLTAFILLYASIFMYITFYFAFIPVVAHEVN